LARIVFLEREKMLAAFYLALSLAPHLAHKNGAGPAPALELRTLQPSPTRSSTSQMNIVAFDG
jgi:hypothetical protein